MKKIIQVQLSKDDILCALKEYCESNNAILKDEVKLSGYNFEGVDKGSDSLGDINLFYEEYQE